MSTPEQQREEPRSSVKIALNAKGEAQIEVKVYAGDTVDEVCAARFSAQDAFADAVSWAVANGFRAAPKVAA
jgi:hypothetical protein